MSQENTEQQIKHIISKIRPYIQRDGGDIRYVRFDKGIVYVEMLGACVGCGYVDTTLTEGVEAILLEEVPGIIGVEKIN